MSLGGGGGGTDYSGQLARQAEQDRQNRIREGQRQVDSAFAGFDDAYFDKYKGDYLNTYKPQVNQQYADTRKNLALALSRSGNLSSSYGAGKMAELDTKRFERTNQLDDQAIQAVNDRKASVESNRSDLYNLATAAADPSQAASAAAARRATLDTPVASSPLGDLFSSFTNIATTAAAAEQAGYYGTGLGIFGNRGGSRPRLPVTYGVD